MNKARFAIVLGSILLFVTAAVYISRTAVLPMAESPNDALSAQAEQSFGQLPLLFVENRGHWEEQVAYAVQGSDKMVYFTAEGVTFALTAPVVGDEDEKDGRERYISRSLSVKPVRSERWVVKLDFVGANAGVRPVGEEGDAAVISYFKGQPDEWNTGLPTFRRLVYRDLWPGIDLVYEGTVNRLKYHFVVHPGADPNLIRLAYRGASSVSLNDAGQLVVETPLGSFEDDTPVAYQEVDGERVLVDMGYVLETAEGDSRPYRFEVGEYDGERPLILDPAVFVYAGYIGGTGSEIPYSIAVDESGNAYITGGTSSDESTFPVEVGPDLTFNGVEDIFVVKINSLGTELIYAGYIGGSGDEHGAGIVVDESGNAYITGHTRSNEITFPVTVGPDLTHNGGNDAFVAKLDPTGTNLAFAGYIGGDDDEEGTQLATDEVGNVYISGWTESHEDTFPVLVGPDLTYNGSDFGDAFVTKVNADGTGLVYSGYIGGNEWEQAWGIAVDDAGSAYISGFTYSTESTFPVVVGPDLTFNGGSDAFVAKVNAAGTGLVYSGYIGGSEFDSAFRIALDDSGNAYLAGDTGSDEGTFPVIVGPDLTYNGDGDAFVAKVNTAGTELVYAGYVGGNEGDTGTGIAVDGDGNAYITGITLSDELSFPVTGGPDLTFNGDDDTFVAKVNPSGTGLVYAGYIGGDGVDWGIGIAVDGAGNAYVVGSTESNETTFPVTVGPDLTYNGGGDAFVAKIALVEAPVGINIDGPETGLAGTAYVFTATTAPITTTLPLTYSWLVTGQPPVTHSGGLTDTAVFTWNITGTQLITVTAWNAAGAVTDTHVVTLHAPVSAVYLPVILKP